MLYGIFAIFMILLSIVGIMHMCTFGSYTYVIFPISTLVWGLYKFFKENDDEYCRRNNINTSTDIGWLFGFEDDYDVYNTNNYYGGRNPNGSNPHTRSYSVPSRYSYSNTEYKSILPKCKRNSMVTTDKVKTKKRETR